MKSKSSQRSAQNVLGYRPVSIDKLKANADNARKWMNFHVLAEDIGDFP
jgi:hypothetical protein